MSLDLSKYLVVVRGAGDLATGTIQRVARAGFPVIALEVERPTAIRRTVALSSCLWEDGGAYAVEDCEGVACRDVSEARGLAGTTKDGRYVIPVLVDPAGETLSELKPDVLIDAILAKKNLGTSRALAPWVVALGPGFSAGKDCDVVIETMRGHRLGRLFFDGEPIPNTGTPGMIGGRAKERVIHAPCAGTVELFCAFGDVVEEGEPVLGVRSDSGELAKVPAPFTGLVRGLIPAGFRCPKGMKIADLDPRFDEKNNVMTISDKSRAIGGGALEAVLYGLTRGRSR